MKTTQDKIITAEEDELYIAQVDLEHLLLHVRFKQHLEGIELRKRLLQIKDIVNTYKLKYLLKDVREVYFIKLEDSNWIAENIIPSLKTSSLLRYARIEKEGSLMQLNSIQLQKKIRTEFTECSPLQFEPFVETESALHWLLSQE